MMDFSMNSKLEPELTGNKTKCDDFQSEITHQDNLLSTSSPKLGLDELSLILRSYWISTKDLLNLRLVNKIWCDAATTTLLQRDTCFVSLKVNCNQNQSCFEKHEENKCNPWKLTNLISHSHKYPSTDFRIQTPYTTYFSDYPDLFLFFQLYGKKIKSLGPDGWISLKCLLDICTVYIPNLECLDLRRTTLKIKNNDVKGSALPVKSLHFSDFWNDRYYTSEPVTELDDNDENGSETDDDRQLIHLLLSSFSKLSCIENVTLCTLGSVLRKGKGQLVKSFTCEVSDLLNNFESTVMQFFQLNPRLSKVTLDLAMATSNFNVPFMNAFIKSFKDTVQTFSLNLRFITLASGSLLKIPPMKCLKSIVLQGWGEFDQVNLRQTIFKFEDEISAKDYFPSLRNVSLDSQDSSHVQSSIMSFFAFKSKSEEDHDDDGGPVWDSLSTVEVLEISDTGQDVSFIGTGDNRQELRLIQPPLFSEMFPNIRTLKIGVSKAPKLAGAWWNICPKVEYMEISDLAEFIKCPDDVSVSNPELSLLLDKFFTGFPLEMCLKLRTSELPQEILQNPELLQFFRMAPSVCDLRLLKELKLRFTYELKTEFATRVTGEYAFSRMPNAKFVISYNPEILAINRARPIDSSDESENGENNGLANDGNNVDGQNHDLENFDEGENNEENIDDDDKIQNYEERTFGSLRPYVQIIREVYPDYWK